MAHSVSPLNINTGDAFALRQSDWIDSQSPVPAGAVITLQAPHLAKYVLFSGNGDFYCRITPNAAGAAVPAAVPAAAITDGSGSERNPAMRLLPDDMSYISIASATGGATTVTLQYFKS